MNRRYACKELVEHVSGTYSTLTSEPYADLYLDYTYQGHQVSVYGNLNVTDHDNMKMFNISVPSTYAKTGLYVHPGLIISFYRASPIQFSNSLIGHWTFTNQTSPAVTAALAHGFTSAEKNMTAIFNPIDIDPNIQPAIKTNLDKEKWTDYVMSLAKLKTGHIRFDSGYFVVAPPSNNGSSCITRLECGSGNWKTPDNHTLQLTYNSGTSSKYHGPTGLPLQFPSWNGAPMSISTILTLKSVTPDRMIATDSHNDTIYFQRDYSPKMILPVNLIGTWIWKISNVDGSGSIASGKFVFEPATHTTKYGISNANFTVIPLYQRANGTTYTFTPDSIKRGNWEIDGHVVSLYYFKEVTNIWLLKVIDNDSVILFGNNGKIMHLVRIGGVEN